MAKKTRYGNYSGILAKPIVVPRHLLVGGLLSTADDDEQRKADFSTWYRNEIVRRLAALFELCGTKLGEPDAWATVAMDLAYKHIPGFQVRSVDHRGKGRPGKWKGDRSVELFADVTALMKRGKSALNACRLLVTMDRFAVRYKGEKQKTLYRRYLEARKNFPPAIRRLVDQGEKEGAPWQSWIVRAYALDNADHSILTLENALKFNPQFPHN